MKPCPFCGYEKPEPVTFVGLVGTECVVECPDCGARGPWSSQMKRAVQLWDEGREKDGAEGSVDQRPV